MLRTHVFFSIIILQFVSRRVMDEKLATSPTFVKLRVSELMETDIETENGRFNRQETMTRAYNNESWKRHVCGNSTLPGVLVSCELSPCSTNNLLCYDLKKCNRSIWLIYKCNTKPECIMSHQNYSRDILTKPHPRTKPRPRVLNVANIQREGNATIYRNNFVKFHSVDQIEVLKFLIILCMCIIAKLLHFYIKKNARNLKSNQGYNGESENLQHLIEYYMLSFRRTWVPNSKPERAFPKLKYELAIHNNNQIPYLNKTKETINLNTTKEIIKELSLLSNVAPSMRNLVVAPIMKLDQYFESLSNSDLSEECVSLNIEFLRLETFSRFPLLPYISTIRLAEEGFFYTGESDLVECFHCHVRYSGWKAGDVPSIIHKEISPNCELVTGRVTENVPLKRERILKVPAIRTTGMNHAEDLTTNDNLESENRSNIAEFDPEYEDKKKPKNLFSSDDIIPPPKGEDIAPLFLLNALKTPTKPWKTYEGKLQLTPLEYMKKLPMYPAFATITIRMSSFKGWPPFTGHTPKSLAAAGFMYAGYDDFVRCFSCGVGLKNWQSEDDVWVEHAKWSPQCVFLRQNKGDVFVKLVHEVNTPENKMPLPVVRPPEPTKDKVSRSSHSVLDFTTDSHMTRVLEMGYPQEEILRAIDNLKKQGKPTDVFNITDFLLSTDLMSLSHENIETPPVRDGLDMIDSFSLFGERKPTEPNVTEKCTICLEGRVTVTLLPCGHTVCCDICGNVLLKCPVCRHVVQGRMGVTSSKQGSY